MLGVKSKCGACHTDPPHEGEMFGVADFTCMEIRREDPKIWSFENA